MELHVQNNNQQNGKLLQSTSSKVVARERERERRANKFVGVRQRASGKWVAEIKNSSQKIRMWLGTFNTAEEAARAYDEAACILRGSNTRTNFPIPTIPIHTRSPLSFKIRNLLLHRINTSTCNKTIPTTTTGVDNNHIYASSDIAVKRQDNQMFAAAAAADDDDDAAAAYTCRPGPVLGSDCIGDLTLASSSQFDHHHSTSSWVFPFPFPFPFPTEDFEFTKQPSDLVNMTQVEKQIMSPSSSSLLCNAVNAYYDSTDVFWDPSLSLSHYNFCTGSG